MVEVALRLGIGMISMVVFGTTLVECGSPLSLAVDNRDDVGYLLRVMAMGCTSDAGKSFLTTALCRYFADRGLRVAPFGSGWAAHLEARTAV